MNNIFDMLGDLQSQIESMDDDTNLLQDDSIDDAILSENDDYNEITQENEIETNISEIDEDNYEDYDEEVDEIEDNDEFEIEDEEDITNDAAELETDVSDDEEQYAMYQDAHYDGDYFYRPETFVSADNPEALVGNPVDSMSNWHVQESDSTCAVVSQEFILEDFTGNEYTEDQLVELAEEYGWYDEGGTCPADVGKILESQGIDVDRGYADDVSAIENALNNGDGVIVGVDANELWSEDTALLDLEDVFSIPGTGANHAVQVIGVDHSNPAEPMIILNDPGHPGGRGLSVPLDEFNDAWEDSANFVCIAHRP